MRWIFGRHSLTITTITIIVSRFIRNEANFTGSTCPDENRGGTFTFPIRAGTRSWNRVIVYLGPSRGESESTESIILHAFIQQRQRRIAARRGACQLAAPMHLDKLAIAQRCISHLTHIQFQFLFLLFFSSQACPSRPLGCNQLASRYFAILAHDQPRRVHLPQVSNSRFLMYVTGFRGESVASIPSWPRYYSPRSLCHYNDNKPHSLRKIEKKKRWWRLMVRVLHEK